MKVNNVADIVKNILTNKPLARDDDLILYGFVINKTTGYSMDISYRDMINLIRTEVLPPFETVRRARQKCQELYPELRGNVWLERNKKQSEYREFAISEDL